MNSPSSSSQALPQIKVCGLARLEDVRVALAAGADALGAVHYPPSPRSVEVEAMAALFTEVPAEVLTVGVVVDLAPAQVEDFLARSGVRALQLCGAQQAEAWAACPVPVLRRIPVDASGAAEVEAWRGVAAGFVLDHPRSAGGSGQTVDFQLAAELATQAPCLLAGGLSAGNAPEAIEAVRPRGVDASSRLELAPGRKNPAAVYAFVTAARAALAALPSNSPSPSQRD
ncbi:MAG: N-(5'-phosphoribosyl)anthranilate isomerase [Planctomycetes bacterium]|nr:N-(5'-phosphoribosyl)anthranilate isomerase [Planctomycetota bacterium]